MEKQLSSLFVDVVEEPYVEALVIQTENASAVVLTDNLETPTQVGSISTMNGEATTPLSATRARMSKVLKRLKKPKWTRKQRRSKTASAALEEQQGYSGSAGSSDVSSSYYLECNRSSSVLTSSSSVDEEQNLISSPQQGKRQESSRSSTTLAIYEEKPSQAASSSFCRSTRTTNSTFTLRTDLDNWCKHYSYIIILINQYQVFLLHFLNHLF
jgi:hypothetical protein